MGSQTALTGAWGFAPQAAKSVAGTNFYWYRVFNSDYGAVTDERPFPQEVGGNLWPTGAYRAGLFGAGGIDFAPRLEDDFAWLLMWLLGENPSTTVDVDIDGAATVGMNRHRWVIDGSEDQLNWGTVHVITPGTSDLGIIGIDNKVTSVRMVLPQSGTLTARFDLVGRLVDDALNDTFLVEGPAGAGWTPSFEDFQSVPVSAKGGFKVVGLNGDAELPVVGLSIDISNALTTPAQEMIIGDYVPDDAVPVAKTLTFRGTAKWSNPDDYQTIVTGSAAGVKWTETVFSGQAQVDVQAPGNVPTLTKPYAIRITAPKVLWQITNPILRGANIITCDLVGTAIKLQGQNVFQLDWQADAGDAGYSWP